MAFLAKPELEELGNGNVVADSAKILARFNRDAGTAAGAGDPRFTITRAVRIMDQKRAVAGGDNISLPEHHLFDPQAIHLGAVGTSQVEQMAERRLALDLKMLAREQKILDHRDLHAKNARP